MYLPRRLAPILLNTSQLHVIATNKLLSVHRLTLQTLPPSRPRNSHRFHPTIPISEIILKIGQNNLPGISPCLGVSPPYH